ncbi:hypothetical protein [Alienimonas chondri]|uniref:Transmembrane protein n=1 Tax=Alienimonas chondri TaxID=2681879 RepID=A0ABX1VGE9_9PLAN|nr:hypothetical protein [Alienimonas chondri]NNJ27116.1 hypothetical protein [Alienimonas chondri]
MADAPHFADDLLHDDPQDDDLLADVRPQWWGTTPAVTPRPWWAGWRPRRRDWTMILEPNHFDPVGPWRRAAVWLLCVPLLAFIGSFLLLVVCMNLRIEPVWSLMNWWERTFWDWALLVPCAVPAAAAGCLWLLRRGRWTRPAKRAALAYAVVVAWLYICGAATISVLAEMF